MQELWYIETITFDVRPGARIRDCIQEALEFSRKHILHLGRPMSPLVSFEFIGVMVSVKADSDAELIYRDWDRARTGKIAKKIGPYPIPITAEEEHVQRHAEHRRILVARRVAALAKLENAPEIEIIDEAAWQDYKSTGQTAYDDKVISYAERWARLMQVEIASGKKLKDIAYATAHDACLDDIPGVMHADADAVWILSTCWKHGKKLLKWHNKQYDK